MSANQNREGLTYINNWEGKIYQLPCFPNADGNLRVNQSEVGLTYKNN